MNRITPAVRISIVINMAGLFFFGRLMIAHSAQLGGAFIGFLIMLYWRTTQKTSALLY